MDEKLFHDAMEVTGLNPIVIDENTKFPQRSEQQEWTPLLQQVGLDVRLYAHDDTSSWKYLVRLCDSEPSAKLHTPRFVEAVNKEADRRINAALTAERQRREQAEKWLDEKREESAAFQADSSKYYNKFLSVLAAIETASELLEKVKCDCAFLNGHEPNCSIVKVHDWRQQKPDLSLLHEHVKKEQQPLVDALNKLEFELRKGFFDRAVALKIVMDALAKVKQ